jgi:hypothetical protein
MHYTAGIFHRAKLVPLIRRFTAGKQGSRERRDYWAVHVIISAGEQKKEIEKWLSNEVFWSQHEEEKVQSTEKGR